MSFETDTARSVKKSLFRSTSKTNKASTRFSRICELLEEVFLLRASLYLANSLFASLFVYHKLHAIQWVIGLLPQVK